MTKPAYIFDLDGTLVDSAPDLHACMNALLDELGLEPVTLNKLTSFIGHGVGVLVERTLRYRHVLVDYNCVNNLDKYISRYKEIYRENPAQYCKTYPWVLETLADLKQDGYALGICTNKDEDLAHLVSIAVGLDKYCSVLIGGDTLALRKPNPAPINECARRLGQNDIIYVGDSEVDSQAAQTAEIPFYLHTRGYRKSPIKNLYHTGTFSDWRNFRLVVARRGIKRFNHAS